MPQSKALFAEDHPSSTQDDQPAKLHILPGGRRQHKSEMRNARRIPISCQVKIRVTENGETVYGTTKDLSVDGVSLLTDYVPRFGQLLDIHVLPPQGSTIKPLRALVQVRRCVRVENSRSYEIGTIILKIRE
ncbi:MAG: PilZ domain-containing protein [Sulfuricella sp.]|nr:PilZ domain-containing protein [Sulfuricella sp.]